MSVIQTIVSILVLRKGPQHMPYSHTLLQVMLLLYVVTGMLAFRPVIETDTALLNMLADIIVMLAYTHILLRTFDRLPRFVQTICAMLGVGVLFHLIAWPLMMQSETVDGVTVITPGASLLMLMLLAWGLIVNAHIYREAMEFSLTSAILLSFSLFFISLAVSKYLFPAG